jgi:hypothetical protein
MKKTTRRKRTVLLALLIVAGMVSGGLAGDLFEIPWWSVDSGGAQGMTGGGYTLSGTIGQPDAGKLTGGPFTLNGGFWKSPWKSPVPLKPATAQDWSHYR